MKRLIGLVGRKRSGKDTVGGFLTEMISARRVAFADPLKEFCREVFDFSEEQMSGDLKEQPDFRYQRRCDYGLHQAEGLDSDPCCPMCLGKPTHLTPRHAMQQLGTEWGRSCCEDIWVRYGLRKANELRKTSPVVITDVRFQNEADAVRQAGGEVWRVHRPGASDVAAGHASEVEQDSIVADLALENAGTLDDLRRAVAAAL